VQPLEHALRTTVLAGGRRADGDGVTSAVPREPPTCWPTLAGRRADAGAQFYRARGEVRRGSDHEADAEADGVLAQIERLGLELLSRLPRS